jgi:hypothetical protein
VDLEQGTRWAGAGAAGRQLGVGAVGRPSGCAGAGRRWGRAARAGACAGAAHYNKNPSTATHTSVSISPYERC